MEVTNKRPTRAQTRARILEAAGEIFTSRGYEGASIDEVAAAAGLTKGAVYSSFAGKDELFFALVADRLDQRLALVADLDDGERDMRDLLEKAEDDLAVLFTTQADWHRLFIECWARAMHDPERRVDWARRRRAARAVITDFFERAQAGSGERLPFPAADLALVSMALSNGLAMEHIADPDSVDPGLFARTLARLVGP
ncbi:MAG: TetR/AcrR family transcriptional regulator [Solirubrobacterales bacterium]